MRRVLVKVGGSLLTLPDLAERLQALFTALEADQILVICGGGQAADAVRNWDRIHGLSDQASHWLAIDSLAVTASLLVEVLPRAALARSRQVADSMGSAGTVAVLVPRPILEELDDATHQRLPVGWDCTSDSIAAWIATQWDVESLVLAKSVDVPVTHGTAADGIAAEGTMTESDCPPVDPCFHEIVTGLADVYWCNVRKNPGDVVPWKHPGAADGRASKDGSID